MFDGSHFISTYEIINKSYCTTYYQKKHKHLYEKITYIGEIKAFIGLMYYRALKFLKNYSLSNLFLELYFIPMFMGCMLHNRFLFLLKHICFDNINSRPDKFEEERFVATQDFFDISY